MADEKDFLIRLVTADAGKAQQDIAAVKKELQGLGNAGGDLGTNKVQELNAAFEDQRKRIADLRTEQQKFKSDIADTVDEIEKERDAFEDVKGSSAGGGSSGIGNVSGLRRTGGALNQLGLGEAGRGVQIAGDIAQLGKFKDIISGISPSVAAAGVGIAGFTIALDLYTKAQAAAKKAADDALQGRQKALELIATGTREEQQAELNRLEDQRKNNVAVAADANKLFGDLRESIKTQLGPAALAAEDLAASTGKAAGAFQAAHDAADAANNALGSTSTEMGILTNATGLTAQSTEDLAKAEASLALRRQAALTDIANIENNLSAQKEAQQEINSGSIDGLAQRKKDIYEELQAINAASAATADLIKQSEGDTEKQKLYRDELAKLDAQFQTLSKTYDALSTNTVEAAVAANDAAKLQDKAGKDLQKIEDDKTSDDKKRADDIDAINAKTAAAYTKLADAYKVAGDAAIEAAKQQDAKTARTRADEDIKTALDRQAKLEAVDTDAAQKEVDRKVKLNEVLKKIDEEYAFSAAGAIQDRDAVALDRAQAKRDKDKSDAISASQDEQKQIQDDREKRFKELRKEFELQDKETKLQRAAQDRETKIARDNDTKARREKYFRDQNDLAAAQRADLLARNNAYVKQISDLKDYLTTRIATDKGYFGTILSAATKFQSDLSNILGGGSASSPSGGGGSSSPNYHNTVPRPGHYAPTQDLDFIPNKATAASSLNPTYIINGSTKSTIKTEVVNHLDGLLNHMGVA